ncbi:class I SAM-dependent methyltransferase [Methylobacterium brachiatum]|uniref:class I SAM-dependent methyltransferase n=1 Tax=Methylobacterium brachiatum TaxID=269660 RepID=UPI0013CF1FAE|nr:class I SAM-dependent methyltransferase [Methylobacterium brachiatum]
MDDCLNQEIRSIPKIHRGVFYQDFMKELSAKRETKLYLEVGVRFGEVFSLITADVAIGVDPDFQLSSNIVARKRKSILFPTTSDAFFARPNLVDEIGGRPDLIFLDGMHLFEFLLRDFYNAESISAKNGLIIMHDCLPLNSAMAERDMAKSVELGIDSEHPGYWTGDVWKVISILQTYRPDLKIYYINCPPTGLVCVTNLDPTNTVLKEKYLDIASEFISLPNDTRNIENLYGNISITDSAAVLNGFDHSIYFR